MNLHFIHRYLLIIILILGTLSSRGMNESSLQLDSLFSIYLSHHDEKKINSANQIINNLYQQGHIDYLYHFTSRSDKKIMNMIIYSGLGCEKYEHDFYSLAIEYALKSIENCPKDSLTWISDNYALISISYLRLGEFDKAIRYAEQGYHMDIKLGDESLISNSLNTLAALYMQNERCDIAEDYILRAIEIERRLGESAQLATRLGMLSDILIKLNRTDEALVAINEALTIDQKGDREEKVAIRLSQMGEVYSAQKKWVKAEECCLSALSIFEKNEATNSISICLRQLANIASHQNHFAEAQNYLLRCKDICQELENNFILQKVYYQLYELYKTTDPAKALSYYEQSSLLKDSIYSLEKQKQISNFQVKYKSQEQTHQIELQQNSIKRKTTLVIALCCGLVLIGVILAFMFSLFKTQRKRNRELIAVNETKDKFFSIISHDLKNPLLAQKNVLEQVYDLLDTLSTEDIKKYCKAIKDSTESVYDLLMNLLQWAQVEANRISYSPKRINLRSLIEETVSVLKIQLEEKKIELVNHLDKDLFVMADANMVSTIIRNLLSNAIKFSYQNGKIEIMVEEVLKSNQYNISIVDYGVGIKPEMISQLFEIGNRSKVGTSGEKGIGLGLVICKKLIKNNQGKYSVKSTFGKGSVFSFTLNKC